MTTNNRAERLLQTWLESEAPQGVPEGLHDRIDTATRAVRPRPRWLARLEGHHMDVIEGGRRSTAPRLGLVLALIGLIVAGLAAAAFFGSRPTNVIVPTTTATPSATTIASQTATATPRPSAVARIPEPGDPIPAELVGVWYVSPGEYLHIQRGPDPYCQARYRVLQDCWVWWDDSQNGIQASADILTIVDGKLRVMSIGRQDCAGNASTATWSRTGNALELVLEPGHCLTRDFPTMFLVGSGEGGAPASVPPLTFP
jgi:hypothetical protein